MELKLDAVDTVTSRDKGRAESEIDILQKWHETLPPVQTCAAAWNHALSRVQRQRK